MNTNYEQIVDVSQIGKVGSVDLNAIAELAKKENFTPAIKDSPTRLVLLVMWNALRGSSITT